MVKAPLFVVPVDFAPEMEATVSAAFALAKQCGAHVHLLEVVSPRAPSLLDDRADVRLGGRVTSKRDWSRLEDSIHAAERGGIHVRTVAYRGDATKIIASYAQLTKARLLVIDKHYGTSRWRRNTRIVSTLSRAAPAPVLVLPPQRRSEKNKSLSFGHIVSAVDFTVASAVAVRTVLDLIRRTGARLTLVHALKNAPHHMVFSGGEALQSHTEPERAGRSGRRTPSEKDSGQCQYSRGRTRDDRRSASRDSRYCIRGQSGSHRDGRAAAESIRRSVVRFHTSKRPASREDPCAGTSSTCRGVQMVGGDGRC